MCVWITQQIVLTNQSFQWRHSATRFMDFVCCLKKKKNMVFQKLDLFLSSGERVGRQFLNRAWHKRLFPFAKSINPVIVIEFQALVLR
jgi:hypothetical protein